MFQSYETNVKDILGNGTRNGVQFRTKDKDKCCHKSCMRHHLIKSKSVNINLLKILFLRTCVYVHTYTCKK